MTMPETEPGLEPEDAGAAEPEAAPDDRRRHVRLLMILLPIALVLAVLGWAFAMSVNRSSGTDSAARAEAARITTWTAESGSQITALRSDSKALAADVRTADLAAVAGDANRLRAAVAAADTLPQVPDTDANAEWETALAAYSSAVQSAAAGARASDTQALANVAGLLGAGDTQLAALTDRLRELG